MTEIKRKSSILIRKNQYEQIEDEKKIWNLIVIQTVEGV